jgi:acyl-CoA synthetase (AMP-forming)/AMP-acid ligase II
MYLQGISRYRATLGWNPNFAYAFMAERVRQRDLVNLDLSSLRGLINCSEPVTQESQDRFLKAFSPCGLDNQVFWGCYAMAETVFALTHGVSEDAGYLDDEGPSQSALRTGSKPFVSVGRPLEGVELMIADQAGHPCTDRQMGEFWVKSPFNLTGYYQNPEATRDVFHQQWYRTGDLGYRAGREFFVCGRKKDVLIIGGVNIYPQDIEDAISQIDGIQKGRVAAFGVFDALIQSQGIVVLAEPAGAVENAHTLIARIGQQITAGFHISNFEIHLVAPGWLVKSSAGKMARRANRLKWQQQSAEQHAHD